jgi:hypothetical protein
VCATLIVESIWLMRSTDAPGPTSTVP